MTAFLHGASKLCEKSGSSGRQSRLESPVRGSSGQNRRISEPGRRTIRPPSPTERMVRRVTQPKPPSFRVQSRIIRSRTPSDPTPERIDRPRPCKISHLRGGSSGPAHRLAPQRPDHALEEGGRGRFFAGGPPERGGEGCFGRVIRVLWGKSGGWRFARTLGRAGSALELDVLLSLNLDRQGMGTATQQTAQFAARSPQSVGAWAQFAAQSPRRRGLCSIPEKKVSTLPEWR